MARSVSALWSRRPPSTESPRLRLGLFHQKCAAGLSRWSRHQGPELGYLAAMLGLLLGIGIRPRLGG
jgi:hypothetical protein